jgi:predicted Zn-dependent peptidase
MAERAKDAIHGHLPCGIEYGVVPLPRRHVVSFQFRILSGVCSEPADKLGLARLIAETIDKGTQQRTGRELSDAFDAIGASPHVGTGRETTTCGCTVLPEHFDRAVALHAEFLRTPTFPEEAFDVAVQLAQQELVALEDDAHGISEKLIGKRAFGSVLGRHPLGEVDTLARIRRDDLEDHWRSNFHSGRMTAAVAGAVDPQHVADVLQNCFDGFGSAAQAGREVFPVEFSPGTTHQAKDLEQEHIGICWPGAGVTHDDFPTQLVILGILAGGMSARLFTEVREKRGLVYWVSAWHEAPRGAGMIFMGASTTPQRCDLTYATLLREVDRLADDVEQEELERAITGIVTNYETRGDSTRARCSELANDLFFFGRPLSDEEKLDKIRAVTIDSVRRCLSAYPRDRLCVVTLGPRALGDPAGDDHEPAGVSTSA